MRVGAIQEGLSGSTGRPPCHAAPTPAEDRPQSRALVACAVLPACEAPTVARQAAFLAQLIATQGQHPQTRARRRAEPDEAIAAYRMTAAPK
jgi:hypothetical protein